MKQAILIASVLAALVSVARAGDIGFIEDFALATDREAALQQLIPGTEDYYFYHCLHQQNLGQLDKVDETLKAWIARYDRTPRVLEIENRQALLRYATQPRQSLDFLIRRLGLQYNHQKDSQAAQLAGLPTRLDPALIRSDTLTRRALERTPNTTQGFETRALDRLVGMNLQGDLRRHLLNRLDRPDEAGLLRLIADDLNHEKSEGFGSLGIHHQLLLPQLEELLTLQPDLLNQDNFVAIYLKKLQPNPDVDYDRDVQARQEHLERLWSFVSRLAPAHNSLKAQVLYHRLRLDRSLGVWDKDRFLAYLKIPRDCPYVNEQFLESPDNRGGKVDLNRDCSAGQLTSVGNDEPLVRSYLEHFFVEAWDYAEYAPYVRDTYLKEIFAETKITSGIGDMEAWYSLVTPDFYQALKDRVDIDFDFTRKEFFAPDEPVALDVYLKNVTDLIVRVYEINTMNCYRANPQPVILDMDLDGLVANEEQRFQYADPALRRVKRHFEFHSLAKRGVYIVEFIGNGTSSRALIQKGHLRHLVRTSVAGHVFTILDESNKRVTDASLWLAGRQYAADKDGLIVVPFTHNPVTQPIVLSQGDFATLASFPHEKEEYRFAAGFYVDRESLLRRRKATVVVRPVLTINGYPAPTSLLEDIALQITATDRQGTTTTKVVRDLTVFDDRESTWVFQVPDNLKQIAFTLRARVQNLSQAAKVDLADSATFDVNGIDATPAVEDLHLMHIGNQYVLELLGKTGEPLTDRAVNVELKHRDFTESVKVSLRTDERGRVALGDLANIEWVQAGGPNRVGRKWLLPRDSCRYPSTIHGQAGEAIYVPYMGKAAKVGPEAFSLLERRGDTFVADRLNAMQMKDGFLLIQGLPRGDYNLLIRESQTSITLRLAEGEHREGYVLSDYRQLQAPNRRLLQIVSLEPDADSVRLRLANAGPNTRVHVLATRYWPQESDRSIYRCLGPPHGMPSPARVVTRPPRSGYATGRNIGEEYRYILERRYARKFPGNMLTRPGLLLNPWSLTGTALEVVGIGGGEREIGGFVGLGSGRGSGFFGAGGEEEDRYTPNLDFLGEPAVLLANLKPDDEGRITIPRKDLGAHQELQVLAIDGQNAVCRELALEEAPMAFLDLRLDQEALGPQKHFIEQKQVVVLQKGQTFVIPDARSAKTETYDSLAQVYRLYTTLSKDDTLREFVFILDWLDLKPEEKQAKYSKYACHELSFFLCRKDPEFFRKVVQPYLRNKKDKTFMDRFMLGDDLSAYLAPWAYEQLNVAERILLAQRFAGEQAYTARHVSDLYDLVPPDSSYFDALFQAALLGSVLEAGGSDFLKKPAAPTTKTESPEEAEVPAGATSPPPQRRVVRRVAGRARLPEKAAAAAGEAEGDHEADMIRRQMVRPLYRTLNQTEEWAENNYYHRPIADQNAELVTINAFWRDYAGHDAKQPFLSTNFAYAHRNFTEMMLALAVLDLPFRSGPHERITKDVVETIVAGGPVILFEREIQEAPPPAGEKPVLVSQNFFRVGDRYRYEGNQRYDKFVTDEFLISVPYGSQIVVTNPTSAPQRLDILLQVPRGAMPVFNGLYTRAFTLDLRPFGTETLEYYFYFPRTGEFPQYPVHIARNGRLIGFAEPMTFKAVAKLGHVDTTSWDYVAQNGSDEEVLRFLEGNNIDRLDLDRIAWRMHDKAFFRQVLDLLTRRHVYHNTLWSYGLKHGDLDASREFLKHQDAFVRQAGLYLDTPLLAIDPVIRKAYQHLEYSPLVNARAHRLGKRRQIPNERLAAQYLSLMRVLSYRSALDDDDLMAVTYYMLLQDRVEEALGFFDRVKPERLSTHLQYDYLVAYLAFYNEDRKTARRMADKYAAYPVDRWRQLFANVAAQLDEIEGKPPTVVDEKDRTQVQSSLAGAEAAFDLAIEGKTVSLSYQNLTEFRVNYYRMDVELLFSKNPFVQQFTGQFSFVKPVESAVVPLKENKGSHQFELPKRFYNHNLVVEIEAGGLRKSLAYYANLMVVQLVENYGQLRVTDLDGRPLAKVYVKVYGRSGGAVKFYKDGYTDLRGKFDYTSLNTSELGEIEKFAILVLSETHGAAVREAIPPKR
jgi:hypothetical protein